MLSTVAVSLLLSMTLVCHVVVFFFFQAEDGIRDLVRSRGLGDVYKRQTEKFGHVLVLDHRAGEGVDLIEKGECVAHAALGLSLIHI